MTDEPTKNSEEQDNNGSYEEIDRRVTGYVSHESRRTAAGHVILPFDEEQFKEFIQGLLGRPQSITKTVEGAFEVTLDDIQDIYSTIEQRISQQNNAWLLQFGARIVFSDNSTVLLNSLDLLLTYRETRPIVSKAVHLTWDYMVQFRDKKTPEKQQIAISVVSSYEIAEKEKSSFSRTLFRMLPFTKRNIEETLDIGSGGYLDFEIKHTARTWGADIEAMLSNYFDSLLKRESKVRVWVRDNAVPVGFLGGLLFYTPLNIGLFYFLLRAQNERISEAREILSSESATLSVDQKLDYIVEIGILGNLIESRGASLSILVAMSSFFIVFILSSFITTQAKSWQPSFLLLTRESEKDKVAVLARLNRRWVRFIWSLILSVLCGLLTNILWRYLFASQI